VRGPAGGIVETGVAVVAIVAGTQREDALEAAGAMLVVVAGCAVLSRREAEGRFLGGVAHQTRFAGNERSLAGTAGLAFAHEEDAHAGIEHPDALQSTGAVLGKDAGVARRAVVALLVVRKAEETGGAVRIGGTGILLAAVEALGQDIVAEIPLCTVLIGQAGLALVPVSARLAL